MATEVAKPLGRLFTIAGLGFSCGAAPAAPVSFLEKFYPRAGAPQ